jgi:hypothetical protein
MSDRARRIMPRRVALAGTAAIALCVPAVPRAHAQEPSRAAELRTEIARLGRDAAAAFRTVDSLRNAESPSVTVTAGGRTLRVDTATIAPADVERLRDGLELGAAELRERYGATAMRLVDTTVWHAYTGLQRGVLGRSVTLRDRTRGIARQVGLPRPVDPERIAQFVLQRAGAELPRLAPTLGAYVGQDVSLQLTPEHFELAGREMALSNASAARRCALGAVLACRAVLTHASGSAGLTLWYETGDYPMLLASAVSRGAVADADSLFYVDLLACTDERDTAACERAVQRVEITQPFSTNLRATLVQYALERGGREALDRLQDDGAADIAALPLLAHVAGTSEDSLIVGWQRHTGAALAASRSGAAPFALSTAFWCGLLLAGASLRRPA